MTKKETLNKYGVTDIHNRWESIDESASILIYREVEKKLPQDQADINHTHAMAFLDNLETPELKHLKGKKILSNMVVTAKRMIFQKFGK